MLLQRYTIPQKTGNDGVLKRETYMNNGHNMLSATELSKIVDIGRSLTSILDLDRLLNRVMDSAVELCDAERGFLMLYENDLLSVRVAL